MTEDNTGTAARPESGVSFEESLSKLEEIVATLEEGSQGLEESMQNFEQGIGLLRVCYGILQRAEQRIELLTGFNAEGHPELEPFDATATVEKRENSRTSKT